MGLFESKESKEMKRQFKEQMYEQAAQSDSGMVQQMAQQADVAYDPQVSAMLLKQGDYFLKWVPDKKKRMLVLDRKYEGFVEPGGMEQLSFLNEKNGDGEFLNEVDSNLMSLLDYGDKYGIDHNVRNSFNKIGRKRARFVNNSRALEGKAQQLAKSQIIKSTGSMTRYNNPNDKPEKLLGFL